MTTSPPVVAALSCLLAFWMGYSVNQGGTCAVATASQLLHRRRPHRLIGLVAASASAGIVGPLLLRCQVPGAQLAGSTDVGWMLLGGAVIFGLGAYVNDACLLGSLGRLGEGEMRLAVLPLGLAAGFLIGDATGLVARPSLARSLLSTSGLSGVAAWGLVLAASLLAIRGEGRVPHPSPRWPLGRAMIVLGATGGALYVTAPAWTYGDLVRRSLPLSMAMDGETALPTVAATIVGTFTSARRLRRWRPRRGAPLQYGQTLLGGLLMGVGASMVPGGNDGLVLAAIPALSPGGAAAYVTMMLTITACLALASRRAAADPMR